jgi:hypothetical protein
MLLTLKKVEEVGRLAKFIEGGLNEEPAPEPEKFNTLPENANPDTALFITAPVSVAVIGVLAGIDPVATK